MSRKRDYYEAESIRTVSFDATWAQGEVRCPHYKSPLVEEIHATRSYGCGGCKRQVVGYDKQLLLKKYLAQDSFREMRHIEILDAVPSPEIYEYRNKIEYSFGTYISLKDEMEERRQVGFHKQGEFAKVLDIERCYLTSRKMQDVFLAVKKLCQDSGLGTYDHKTKVGIFRHMVIREGVRTGQLMVNLSISDENLLTPDHKKSRKNLKESLAQVQDQVTTFIISYQNGLADVMKTNDTTVEVLRGEGVMIEALEIGTGRTEFEIGPWSFFQTNTLGAEKLFGYAMNMVAGLKGKVLDLYCGAGTIGLAFAKAGVGQGLVGIEIVPEAIEMAHKNAARNGIEGAHFYVGKAEEVVTRPDVQKNLADLGLIIVDPPRDGMHKDVIDFLNTLKNTYRVPLLYISCNPVTMARDISALEAGGWAVSDSSGSTDKGQIRLVDMFPHTNHIESIALLLPK